MKIKKLVVLSAALFSMVASAEVVTGSETVYLTEMAAYKFNAERDYDEEHNATCNQKFGWVNNKHAVELEYNINTKTGMQYASANLLNIKVEMLPMGIAGKYAFLSQRGIPDELKTLHVKQIYFRLSKEFELQTTAVTFLDKSLDFQCIAQTVKD